MLPFEDESFDLCYSFGVLHHIPDNHEVIEEARRVLKGGGQFWGMVYNHASLLNAFSIRFLGLETEWRKGCPYVHIYDREEFRFLLSRYFENVTVVPRYNVIDLPWKRKVKFTLEGGGTELGWHLVFKGVKK